MWQEVDYFFINKISIIGYKLLATISESLSNAKGYSETFDRMNMICAGNFAQLSAIRDKGLHN
ncbi:hypothetical protein OBBRIDRAFT_741058 [Obba rivulosa]|uniref:Uncharacterized protein n=1 Tax=Obba rivulosa TaxID=1052685 RepID=A0A8E2DFF5_9APHY|nr:hypothetical protein OBBRIDRAFT_741058 [Obba rivulosa]